MSAQHIPIFVGSTYLDLKEHRKKVYDTLTRMETFVHGMEHFGARPASPVEECLNEVRRCRFYIGIFAMRYGSIPKGYKKSMTELEYEEAQRLNLPSFIFLINEKEARIYPQDVDFENQTQLQSLKKHLSEKHLVEFFDSPDGLANKVGIAIHKLLIKEKEQGHFVVQPGIEDVIPSKTQSLSTEEILRRFHLMPARWNGVQFEYSLSQFDFREPIYNSFKLSAEDCNRLAIQPGTAIYFVNCSSFPYRDYLWVISGKTAEDFLDLKIFDTVIFLAETVYCPPKLRSEKELLAIRCLQIMDVEYYDFEERERLKKLFFDSSAGKTQEEKGI